MRTIEVMGVVPVPAVVDWLESFNLEAPETGAASEVATFLAAGWVLPRLPQTVTIEVVHGSAVIGQLIANQKRPDVAQQQGTRRAHGRADSRDGSAPSGCQPIATCLSAPSPKPAKRRRLPLCASAGANSDRASGRSCGLCS